jgi:hypothetical protein
MNKNDNAFEMAAAAIRFGVGVTREVGSDLADLGARNVLVVTDPAMARLPPVQTVLESLAAEGIRFVLYDRVRVEPTDESFLEAIAFANGSPSTRWSPSAAARPSTRPRPSISTRPIRRLTFSTT